MQMAHLSSSGKLMLTKLAAGRKVKLLEGDTNGVPAGEGEQLLDAKDAIVSEG